MDLFLSFLSTPKIVVQSVSQLIFNAGKVQYTLSHFHLRNDSKRAIAYSAVDQRSGRRRLQHYTSGPRISQRENFTM